jgi:hypothetical protein
VDPEWNQQLSDMRIIKKVTEETIARARNSFPLALAMFKQIGSLADVNVWRVKTSLLNKLFREVRVFDEQQHMMKGRGQTFIRIYDMIGGRVVVRGGWREFEQKVTYFENESITFGEWKRYMKTLKSAEKDMNTSRYKELVQMENNMIDPDGRFILIRRQNRFVAKKGEMSAGHYKTMQYTVALGRKNETFEIQFTNLDAIPNDIDHEIEYKTKKASVDKVLVRNSLVKWIWLTHIVNALNYMYEDKNLDRGKFFKYFDLSETVDGHNSMDLASLNSANGGVDIRDVDGVLKVKGMAPRISLDLAEVPEAEFDGLRPQITAVMAIDRLPFLPVTE